MSENRGQTTIDYAIGVSIFLVVVAFVFTMVPNLFTPYESGIQSGQPVQAERFAGRTYDAITYDNGTLNASAYDDFFTGNGESALRDSLGANATTDVNVTVIRDGTTVHAVGPPPTRAFASATRVVVGDSRCPGPNGCRVVVRVW